MILVPALGVAFFVVLLLVVPSVVIWRDLVRGRPDVSYRGQD